MLKHCQMREVEGCDPSRDSHIKLRTSELNLEEQTGCAAVGSSANFVLVL
jgi:hypothetical protein